MSESPKSSNCYQISTEVLICYHSGDEYLLNDRKKGSHSTTTESSETEKGQ